MDTKSWHDASVQIMKSYRMRPLSIIVAVDYNGGMGYKGKLPWNYPEDLKRFQEVTKGGVCIMGRKTYEEILEMKMGNSNIEPTELLPGRECHVLSRSDDFQPVGARRAKSIRAVVQEMEDDDRREIFVIGGEKLFIEALTWTNKIYMTVIRKRYKCDRFFPVTHVHKNYKIDSGEENSKMYFINYIRV